MEGAVPVPQRAHALLHRRPRQGPLPLLRLRRRRRRHPLRAPDRPPRVPRGRRGARVALRRDDPAPPAQRPARRPARPALRGALGGAALLRRAARAARQRGRGVPRGPRRAAPRCGRRSASATRPTPGTRSARRSRRRIPEDLLVEAGLLQPRAGGQGRLRPLPRPAALRRARRPRAPGRIRRPRALAGGRAQVPELARVAGLLEEAAALRPLRGARAIRKHDRVVLVEGYFDHLALVRGRHRGDGRVDGHRPDARAGGEAAAPLPARGRLLRRRLRGPQRHARRPRSCCSRRASTPGSRGCPRARIPYDLLQREGPEALARAIDEAPDYLTWLLEDLRPGRAGPRVGREAGADRQDPRDPQDDPRPDPPVRGVPQARGGRFRPTRSALGRRKSEPSAPTKRVLQVWERTGITPVLSSRGSAGHRTAAAPAS